MYQRILVPVDGSPTSAKGVEEATKLARLTGANLRLFHSVEMSNIALGFDAYAANANDSLLLVREAGQRILEQAAARVASGGVAVDTFLCERAGEGVADLVIEQAKAWEAELIVIGTHGRRGVGRLLLGSTAEEVVRRSPVPVLLVRAMET